MWDGRVGSGLANLNNINLCSRSTSINLIMRIPMRTNVIRAKSSMLDHERVKSKVCIPRMVQFLKLLNARRKGYDITSFANLNEM